MPLIFLISSILLFHLCHCFNSKFDVDTDTIFKLYKRENLTKFHVLNKNESDEFCLDSLDLQIPTRIYTHGYHATKKSIKKFRDAFLNAGDFNFIAIDWTKGADNVNYFVAKSRMKRVSKNGIIFEMVKCYQFT